MAEGGREDVGCVGVGGGRGGLGTIEVEGRTTTSSPPIVDDDCVWGGMVAEATTFTASDTEPLTEVTTRARDAIAIPSSDVEIN